MPQIEVSEATISYEQIGTGPDIVWVAGGGGLAVDWVPYQMPFFEGAYRNTIFDNVASGRPRPTSRCRGPSRASRATRPS